MSAWWMMPEGYDFYNDPPPILNSPMGPVQAGFDAVQVYRQLNGLPLYANEADYNSKSQHGGQPAAVGATSPPSLTQQGFAGSPPTQSGFGQTYGITGGDPQMRELANAVQENNRQNPQQQQFGWQNFMQQFVRGQ